MVYEVEQRTQNCVCLRNTRLSLAIKKLFKLIQIKISYSVEEKTSQIIQKLSFNNITDFFFFNSDIT